MVLGYAKQNSPSRAEEYRAFVVAEAEKFGRIVQQANIKAEN